MLQPAPGHTWKVDTMKKLLNYGGRPCEITGASRRRHQNPKWGWVNLTMVRYLDGQLPATATVTTGSLSKAKAMRDNEAIYWRRADELIQLGMEAGRAREQAMAELAKGLLSDLAF